MGGEGRHLTRLVDPVVLQNKRSFLRYIHLWLIVGCCTLRVQNGGPLFTTSTLRTTNPDYLSKLSVLSTTSMSLLQFWWCFLNKISTRMGPLYFGKGGRVFQCECVKSLSTLFLHFKEVLECLLPLHPIRSEIFLVLTFSYRLNV